MHFVAYQNLGSDNIAFTHINLSTYLKYKKFDDRQNNSSEKIFATTLCRTRSKNRPCNIVFIKLKMFELREFKVIFSRFGQCFASGIRTLDFLFSI